MRVLTTDTDTGATEPDAPDVLRELRWHLRDGEFDELGRVRALEIARHNHARPATATSTTCGPTSSPGGRWAA